MQSDRSISITEDGEAIGTIQQFSHSLHVPRSILLQCVRTDAQDAVVLNAGEGRDQLLIVDTGGLEALRQCARRRT